MVRQILVLGLLAGGIACAQSADDVSRETQRLRVQYDEERRGASADSARQAQWRSQSRERLSTMRADARRLSRERDSLRSALDVAGRPKPPPPPPVAPATVRRRAFAEALAREIDRTVPLLAREAGDPSEVRSRWIALSKGLRSGSTDPDEAMGRFLDDLSERIDAASRIAARPGSWTDSTGRTVRGSWIDVGHSLSVFSGNDGSAAVGAPGGRVRPVSDPAVRSSIARGARVLSGQAAPAWVPLPLVDGGSR